MTSTSHRPVTSCDPAVRLGQLPNPKRRRILGPVGLALILGLGFFAKLTPGVLPLELAFDEALTDVQHPILNTITVGMSTLFAPPGAIALALLAFVFLLVVKRAPVNAFAFTGQALFGWLSCELFKLIIHEPRPDAAMLDNPLLPEAGFDSYPSGHTTFVAAFAISCWLLARGTRWQRLVAILGVTATLLMGASRLYVSAHYLTDVIGSCLVATTAYLFFAPFWNRAGVATLRTLSMLR